MAYAKFQENRFKIDREIAENHVILVNLTASIAFCFAILNKLNPGRRHNTWKECLQNFMEIDSEF